jgi:DNA-binding CsgD family transcriptional regulator
MSPWLARVRGSLRVLGVRRPLPGKRTDGLLSTREREILELVGGGLTTREIAGRLAIASSTVETLVRSSMAKLGAHTRKQAAATALGRDE